MMQLLSIVFCLAAMVSTAIARDERLDLTAPDCSSSGAVALNESVRHLVDGCDAVFASPDGKRFVRFDAGRGVPSVDLGNGVFVPVGGEPVIGPAMFSWSPSSDAFFVNDGGGSGQDSVLRVYRIGDGGIEEDVAFQTGALSKFRALRGCGSQETTPVWGLGWGDGGRKLFAIVQPPSRADACGAAEGMLGVVFLVPSSDIVMVKDRGETVAAFGELLPENMRKPN